MGERGPRYTGYVKTLVWLMGLSLAGFAVAAPEETKSAASAYEAQGWPSLDEREDVLSQVPAFSDFVQKEKWDEFETDRFIFRAKKVDAKRVLELYPAMKAGLLKEIKAKLKP